MTFELANCTAHLLQEISDPTMGRIDVAQSYALAIKSSEDTNWKVVNAAIIERWSRSALGYIKYLAHTGRCFRDGRSV